MCGIVGFVGSRNDDLLTRMRDRLRHRGPDDAANYRDDSVSLGHRRLAILDLSPTGKQPMASDDGDVILIFNGEIYNHLSLRSELEASGRRFRGRSDTETILHAYQAFGTDCVRRLDGMFAFVLYDRKERRLFGARDRLGKKPLYYTNRSFGSGADQLAFAFASEIKALREHPALRTLTVNHKSLVSYLLHDYVAGPESIFAGISRLPPGHAFTFGLEGSARPGFSSWPYWRIRWPLDQTTSAREAEDVIVELLAAAVERRLMADVPLGVLLSGGIDSSAVLALMTRFRPAAAIDTFSIGFDDPSFDESPYARRVAAHFGTRHHHRQFCAADLTGRLPALARMLDEPFADPSVLPVAMLSEFARETVTVALGGDGGDELFAGYDPFRAVSPARLYRALVPGAIHLGLILKAARRLPASTRNMSWSFRVQRFLRGARAPDSEQSAIWMAPFALTELAKLIPDLGEQLAPEAAFALERSASIDEPTPLRPALDFFERIYLPDDILVKVDRASMLASLEVRTPYLDTALVEFVNPLPDHFKLRNGVTKWIFKQALLRRNILPADVVQRKKKGFGIPAARWIAGELAQEFRRTLIDDWPATLDMFDRREIARLLDRHQSNQENLYKELWALFMLAHWANTHL